MCALIFAPCVVLAADNSTGFNMAAQLLSAARNGNTRLVQNLINSGADVNYVDSTGLSVVCTAVMNNDTNAVQVLQMYGADASNCDRQIKNYQARMNPVRESGVFSGLSSTHELVLGVIGAAAVVGGLLWATDAFDGDNHNGSSGNSGNHSGNNENNGGSNSLTAAFTVPYGPRMVTSNGSVSDTYNYSDELNYYSSTNVVSNNFSVMNNYGNYLLMMHGYSPFARGYLGQSTLRSSSYVPVPPSVYGDFHVTSDLYVSGGIPINVALVTANGINAAANTSLQNRYFAWTNMSGSGITDVNAASTDKVSSKYFNNNVTYNSGTGYSASEITSFDLSGNNTAINNTAENNLDNLLAKIVGGYTTGNSDGVANSEHPGDFTGFMPNGQMTIYRTGGGKNSATNDINYYNYRALVNAATNSVTNATTDAATPKSDYGRAKISVIANLDVIEPLYSVNTKTVRDFVSLAAGDYQTTFYTWVGNNYNNSTVTPSGYNTPSQDAQSFFGGLGVDYFPLTVFSVGGTETDSSYSGAYQHATFENAAPLAFSGANKLFMSVVAVNLPAGATSTASSVNGFSTSEKYSLSRWQLGENYYKSRVCGVGGTGSGTVDPWCFAAAGLTDEQATAAAAGAAGALKAAFSYMSNQNIFTLLALTADGAYLGTNPSTGAAWTSTDDLVSYLQSMYILPQEYQTYISNGSMTYLNAFKEVFGYGLINLERATTPGHSVYYYSNGKIVSASGNAYWRSAQNSSVRGSSVFGGRGASVPVSFYDVLTSADGELSLPRVWNMNLSLGNDASYGLYMGDTLAELKTRDVDNKVSVGNLTFGFARSERNYDDNMSGVDNLSIAYDSDRFSFYSDYQHYLTDEAGRFTGLANPVLSLASNAVTSRFALHNGRVSLMGRGFIGNITSEGLLENDPAISSNFAAAKLGDVIGAESGIKFGGDTLSLTSNVGTMHESGTVLGAMWGGLLDTHGADTNYVDSVLSYNVTDNIGFTLRGTYAWTDAADITNGIVTGLSELKSNSFAAGIRLGNFDFVASMPLALTDGRMYYSYADFGVDENNNLLVRGTGEYALDLTPDCREYRFNASYRHSFGEWTDGALGFIYRINPNNTDAFGNESIFMMKLSHRLGI